MRTVFTFLAALTLSMASYSQDPKEELTLKDAVMGYYKGLYPENMYGTDWTSTNKLYRKKGNEILVYEPNKKGVKKWTGKTLKYSDDLGTVRRLTIDNQQSYHYNQKGKYYHYNKGKIVEFNYPNRAENITLSPTKNQLAYTLKNNLFLANTIDSSIVVTTHEDPNIVAGQSIHRNEFGIKNGIFWSNDGNKIAFYEKDESDVHDYPLLNINDTPGQLKSVKYPMAGQKSEYGKVGVYNTKSKSLIYLKTVHKKDDYVTNLTWGPKNEFIYIAELNRDQNHMKWAKYDATTGKRINTIFEETNDKWVEPEYPLYFIPESSDEFVTLSERDGFMNIYHYNTSGELINQVTNNTWVTTDILAVEANKIIFQGTGEDPRESHAFSVNLDGSNQRQITTDGGMHRTKISPNKRYLLDQFSSLGNPGKTQVIDLKTNKKNVLHEEENPLENYDIGKTTLDKLKATDGTSLYLRLIKPNDFNPSNKYPVLIYVYGGPHAQLVTNSWLGGASLWMHWMANQGYIVFTVDGRGSAHRGFEFESAIFRNLGQLEMKDQLAGVEFLKTLPYIDTERIAVHGWSYGGFMTTSLLTNYPAAFSCGVAGGPVIDWKWYEVMYGERYMDQPQTNPEGYKKTSLLNQAKSLEDPLLLIHGTADDVVVMQHNLAFVKACVESGTQVDFFPYPMHKHNVRGKDRVHLMEKVLNYILTNNK
ncbi:MAG: DPP IV N-terminal domain-containing protein [Bacteroidota bacterium]|nr:DPP IV N-terminal domain-containing protein [Bacteroidota bacterium]